MADGAELMIPETTFFVLKRGENKIELTGIYRIIRINTERS
jgi:hypothetical protein